MYKLQLSFVLIVLMMFYHGEIEADDTLQSTFTLKLMKTYPLPNVFNTSFRSFYDNIRIWNDDYVPAIQSLYVMNRSDILKLTLSTGEVETLLFGFDLYQRRKDTFTKLAKLPDYPSLASDNLKTTFLVSPNGKYGLLIDFPYKNELYEMQSGKLLSCGIDDEIILGFDSNSNIYCGRQSLANLFVLRNPENMSLLWEYQSREYYPERDSLIQMDFSTNQGDNPGSFYDIQFSNCRFPISSPDGKYSVLMFTVHQFRGHLMMVFVFDNLTKTLCHSSCITPPLQSSTLNHLFRHDGKMLAIPNGRWGVWVYDVEINYSRSCVIPNAGFQKLAGFCFTPDNHVILWLQHHADIGIGGLKQTAYRFNLENGAMEEFTDFSVKDRYTRLYFFSPDGRTAITFETIPGRPFDFTGRYVFWDVNSKARLLETEETYLPNIIISPDWTTIYLAKTTDEPPSRLPDLPELPRHLWPLEVEIYDITNITERSDD